jgi:PKD repeat protein
VRGDDGNDYVLARDATARTVIFGGQLSRWWDNGNQQLVRNAIEWSTQIDIPWLSENPITGTVEGDSSSDVDVTFTAFPTMTFGTYTATLLVDTEDAINDPINVPVTMTVTAAPDCGFTSSSPDEWHETTTFTNTTIGAALTYTWDFGDDAPVSTLENPTHTYAHVGFYTAVLTATNAHGVDVCSGTVSIEGVEGGFTSNSPVDLGQATFFTNTTRSNPPIQQYFWTFGDSTSSEDESPTHTYAAPGIYTVTLFASNVPGVLNVYDIHQKTVEVQAATSYGVRVAPRAATAEGVSSVPVFYTLQVDNTGNVSETFNIDATGNWTTTVPSTVGPLGPSEDSNMIVTVTIPSTALDDATDSSIITVASQTDPNQSATAILTTTSRNRYGVALAPHSNTQSGQPSDLVTYTLRVTNTGNTADVLTTTVTGENWTTNVSGSVGALDSGEGKDIEVVVEIPSDAQDGNNDSVSVTVASQNDGSKSDTSTLTTTAGLACDDVEIEALTSDSPVTLGDPMHFTATVTGTTPITYSWDFDNDGTPEQSGTDLDIISHTFDTADTYTVTLDVENECSTDTRSISVATVCTPVQSVEIDGPTTALSGTAITLNATYTPADATDATLLWDNGETGDSAEYVWTEAGPQTVVVTATAACGDPITATHTVTVNPVPCEDVSIDDLTSDSPVTLGDPMHFTATVTGTTPITYSWDFDNDGTPEQSGTDLDIISHTYSSADTYTVTLDVENECSTDSHSTEVTVNGHNIYLPLVLRNHQ